MSDRANKEEAMKGKYPVGATWKGTDKYGSRATIWLDRREKTFDIWQWKYCYFDGSAPWNAFDWSTSYRGCKDQLPIYCRMRRVKEITQEGK